MPIVFASTYDEATNASTFTRDRSAEKTFVTDDQLDETNEQLEDLERKFEEAGPGENGITPHIGDNGNWFIGETDTGKPSRGEKGEKGDSIKGDKGDKGDSIKGDKGNDGKTAYAYAQDAGYTGTEEEFAEKLAEDTTPFVFEASLESNSYLNGVTFDDIWAAYAAGRTVIGRVEFHGAFGYAPLVAEADGMLVFSAALGNAGAFFYAHSGGIQGAEFQLATPDDIPVDLSQFTNEAGYIKTETDPTVPAWAKAASKPSYGKGEVGLGNVDNVKQYSASNPPPYPVTSVNSKTGAVSLKASDVGADASGTASTAVSNHNVSDAAHNDIRLLIQGLTTRLDALANSDDTTLDQMAELVAYIKANRGLIEQVTTNKVNVSDIVNNLTTNVNNKPLSAAQGVALKTLIDALDTALDGKLGGADLTKALIVNKLGYTPADKAYEYPTPQEYGAKGDGTTDDTTAFRNAVAANRVVFVPGGTYKLSGELTLGQSVCLKLSPDTVLDFTQTTGNCISMRASSSIEANHGLIKVPETFSGRVINIYAGLDEDLRNVPPFTHWGPMWNAARYITDLHIAKINRYGGARSVGGVCSGTAVYLGAHRGDGLPYLWAVDLSRLRIAGGFQYGIHLDTVKVGMDAWIHQTRISAFISGAEVGVYCKESTLSYLDVMVLPEKASDDATVFAKHGIVLENSTNVDLSGSRVMDWDANHSLWTEGGMYQHLALIGDCSGAILSEHYYYDTPTHDIRSLIYTDTPSNLERLTILQEPITRWFKPIDLEPYFNNGETTKKLALSEELDEIATVDKIPNFTDVLPTAIDKSGAIFEGAGFVRYGMRWGNGNADLYTNQPYYGCTGLIPIKSGDRVYLDGIKLIYGTDTTPNVVVFKSDFSYAYHATAGNIATQTWYLGYEETEDGFIVDMKSPLFTEKAAAYVAFSFKREAIGAKPRISINNPISYILSGVLAEGIKVTAEQVVGLPEPGTGPKGDTGERGTGILNTTTGIAAYTTSVGGVYPKYRILLSTLKAQAKVNEVLIGDTVRYSTFLYPIIYVDNDNAYMTTRVSIQGATGATGTAGTTPVKGTDYFTEADKAEMVEYCRDEIAANTVEVINLKEKYGLDDTGAVDCSALINQAISEANSGSTLYLPTGTYLLNSTVNVNKGINLKFDGVMKYSGTDFAFLFKNFSYSEAKFNRVKAPNGSCIKLFSDWSSEKNYIQHSKFYFNILTSKANTDTDNGGYCIFVELQNGGWVNENRFNGGVFEGGYGFHVDCKGGTGFNGNVFDSCAVEGVGIGFYLANGCQNNMLLKCRHSESFNKFIVTIGTCGNLKIVSNSAFKITENVISDSTTGLVIANLVSAGGAFCGLQGTFVRGTVVCDKLDRTKNLYDESSGIFDLSNSLDYDTEYRNFVVDGACTGIKLNKKYGATGGINEFFVKFVNANTKTFSIADYAGNILSYTIPQTANSTVRFYWHTETGWQFSYEFSNAEQVKELIQLSKYVRNEEAVKSVNNSFPDENGNIEIVVVEEEPIVVGSLEECVDTTKKYVLPDGYIYAYRKRFYPGGESPNFTNLLPSAKDFDLEGIYNDIGYKYSTVYSTSNKKPADSAIAFPHFLTGLNPVKLGDTVRINKASIMQGISYIYLFDSAGTYLAAYQSTTFFDQINKVQGTYTIGEKDVDGNQLVTDIKFTVSEKMNWWYTQDLAYLCFQYGPQVPAQDVIITVNEEITYTVTEDRYEWKWESTGELYVKPDYLGMINKLEERVAALEKLNA